MVQLCEKYLSTKINVKLNTQANCRTTMKILRSKPFGQMPIHKVKEIDAKELLIRLQPEDDRSARSIHSIRGVLRPAFAMAVKNDLIRKNPFDFQLVDDSVQRKATTREQKRKSFQFVSENSFYRK